MSSLSPSNGAGGGSPNRTPTKRTQSTYPGNGSPCKRRLDTGPVTSPEDAAVNRSLEANHVVTSPPPPLTTPAKADLKRRRRVHTEGSGLAPRIFRACGTLPSASEATASEYLKFDTMALDAIEEFLIKYGDGKQIANEDNDQEFKCVSQEETLLVNLMTSPKDRVLIQIMDARIADMAAKIPLSVRADEMVEIESSQVTQQIYHTGKKSVANYDIRAQKFMTKITNMYLISDMIMMPFCFDNNWLLVVVNAKKREIQVLNPASLPEGSEEDRQLLNAIHNLVKGLHFHLEVGSVLRTRKYNKWPDTDVKQWPIVYIEGLPQQTDTTSNGLFVLKYIEHWDGNRLGKKFNQAMIDSFRRKLVYILYNSSLNLVKPQT
ncbi:hypothetical protein EJB05_29082, partial [Eragrostis curvula]